MSGYRVAGLDAIEELNDGREPYRPVRHHFGITSFGITAWTGRTAGDRILNEHDEADTEDMSEELYLVQIGRAAFELDGERVDAPAGTFVYASPGVKRTAFAEEPGTTIVAIGGVSGKAYEPVGWELWAPIRPQYEAGEHEAVVERLREVVEASPQYALLFYNLACCESLTGRTADAIAHLGRQSTCRRSFARTRRATPTSTRSARSRRSRSSSAIEAVGSRSGHGSTTPRLARRSRACRRPSGCSDGRPRQPPGPRAARSASIRRSDVSLVRAWRSSPSSARRRGAGSACRRDRRGARPARGSTRGSPRGGCP